MTDILTPRQRSALMAKVKSSGNAATELRLIAIFRAHGITGWRRGLTLRPAAPRSSKTPRASATSNPRRVRKRVRLWGLGSASWDRGSENGVGSKNVNSRVRIDDLSYRAGRPSWFTVNPEVTSSLNRARPPITCLLVPLHPLFDLNEALLLGEHIAAKDRGNLEQLGTTEEFQHAPHTDFGRDLLRVNSSPAAAGRAALLPPSFLAPALAPLTPR